MRRIIFVCVGNMCRSQMAEGLARALGGDAVMAESAGTHPTGTVSREAILVMSEIGVDLAGQWSKGLNEVNLAEADVIVSMAEEPAESLAPRGFRGLMDNWDVGDPVGFPLGIFRIVRRDIAERVTELLRGLGIEPSPSAVSAMAGDGEEDPSA